MQIVIDETDVDEDRTETIVDAVLLCLSSLPFEYSEQEAAVALCSVLALIMGHDTLHDGPLH
jgi:hypothetical protein